MIISGALVGLIMAVGTYLTVAVIWYAIASHSARYNLRRASQFDRTEHLRRAERQADAAQAAWYWPVYLVMAMVHAIADTQAEIGDIAGQRTPLHAAEQLEREVDRLRRRQQDDQ